LFCLFLSRFNPTVYLSYLVISFSCYSDVNPSIFLSFHCSVVISPEHSLPFSLSIKGIRSWSLRHRERYSFSVYFPCTFTYNTNYFRAAESSNLSSLEVTFKYAQRENLAYRSLRCYSHDRIPLT